MEENETDKTSNTNLRIKLLNKEFKHKFFKEDDLKAAAGIGSYFSLVSYLQQEKLKTRTLIKDTRIWFKEFNKSNLLDIFHECTRILMALSEKNKHSDQNSTNIGLSKLRNLITQYLKDDEWNSPHEELSLAFMIGYDLYVGSNKEKEKDKEEV